MATAAEYVTTDEHGVMRVGHTRVMLDSVVASFREGCSAETIQQQYPALSLEEIYGAIAFYLGHRASVDAYLANQEAVWDRKRAVAERESNPVVARLRAEARRLGIGRP
ncbi:MAG: DUF433 domain-containing protein [Planctomycetia bacterium]|nr:DUF433 domain-containing protein [Planctomycetia bacterium]